MICDTNSDSNYESQASNFVSYDSRRRRGEEEEEIREEISPTTQVQPSTSSAVLVKKRGRPADSPGTKLRKASEKALLKIFINNILKF